MADVIFQNELNLVLQIVILLIFLTAILIKLRKHSLLHGSLMLVAFALNMISILFIIGPLLLGALPFLSTNT